MLMRISYDSVVTYTDAGAFRGGGGGGGQRGQFAPGPRLMGGPKMKKGNFLGEKQLNML